MDELKWTKQPIEQFPVGTRVVNTQQLSHSHGDHGIVAEVNHRKNTIRVLYDNGSGETMKGEKVWLRKE